MADRSADIPGATATNGPQFAINTGHGYTINGGQTNNFNTRPSQARNPTLDNPCISPALLMAVSTYVDRPTLSEDIASKMRKSCGNKSLVHALAVTGLGGTGKTQLVLHYIREHRKRYDTILWLNAQDVTTMMSSFERCCNALSINFEQQSTSSLPHDASAVQKLLEWLASREQEQKWLVIVDNADNLDQLYHFIPHNGLAGSIIVTSQDRKAAKLLRAKPVMVDKMDVEEGQALLAQIVNLDLARARTKTVSALKMLINELDGVALAIDLAGARIRDDMDGRPQDAPVEDYAIAAIDKYSGDMKGHKESLLSDPEQSKTSSYNKTVRTVWETVLGSLARSEQSDAKVSAFPVHLLKLAVLLGPNVVCHEIFRSASQTVEEIYPELKVDLPLWFKSLLQCSESGSWDSFAYRASLIRLKRFNLVHDATEEVECIVKGPERRDREDLMIVRWPAFAIHGLVRWRTAMETTKGEYEICRVILLSACCRTSQDHLDGIDFRFALRRYLPTINVTRHSHEFTTKGFADLCFTLGATFMSIYDLEKAESLLELAYDQKREIADIPDVAEIRVLAELHMLYMFMSKSHSEDSPKHGWYKEKLSSFRTTHQRLLLQPKSETTIMARLYSLNMDEHPKYRLLYQLRADFPQQPGTADFYKAVASRLANFEFQIQETIRKREQELENAKECLDDHDHTVVELVSSLARILSLFGRFDDEQGHLEVLLAYQQEHCGQVHANTLQTMERRALCRLGLEHFEGALQSMQRLADISSRVLGDDDPRTRLRKMHIDMIKEQQCTSRNITQEMKDEWNEKRAAVGPFAKSILTMEQRGI